MSYQKGNLIFDWNGTNKISNVLHSNVDLETELASCLAELDKQQGHPSSLKKAFLLTEVIEKICTDVFDAIKEIKNVDKDDYMAAYLASFLFERLAGFWKNELLKNGLFVTGVSFWQEVISITKEWELKNKPITVHKGTPFFFLASNCLQNGDRDNGFTYLYNALEEDKKLPKLGYPEKAPAFFTATMTDDSNNYMYDRVQDLRIKLRRHLSEFNKQFSSFSIEDFDSKFLKNNDLSDVVYFFVYNFQYVYDQEKNTNYDLLQNEFSRLRILDLFFNFGLIIDKILTYSSNNSGNSCSSMKDAVAWWSDTTLGVNQNQFDTIIGINNLNLNNESPDNVIPVLLNYIHNNTGGFDKRLFIMLLAYRLRNHGGHNLDQQTILSSKYEEILNHLFFALFLAVRSIP